MHYDGLIARMRKAYPFLKGTRIETVHGYGHSSYKPDIDSIVVFFEHVLWFTKDKRFAKRFGKVTDFEHAVTLVLLHEIHHVYQHRTMDAQVLFAEQRAIEDSERHDDSWMEKEADDFANKEIGKWILKK